MGKSLSPHTVNLVDALNRIAGQPRGTEYENIFSVKRFHAMPGGVRDRVVVQTLSYSNRGGEPTAEEFDAKFTREQRSVKCFVDRATGSIHYAGSWDSPAKWKSGPAIEFGPDEHDLYAEFIRDGGWGYQGDRKRWEERKAESE